MSSSINSDQLMQWRQLKLLMRLQSYDMLSTHTPRCPCFIGSCKNWLNVCIFLQTKSPRRATEEEERRLKLLSKVLAIRPPRETCIRCQLLGRQPPSETCTVHRVPLLLWNPSAQCAEIQVNNAQKSYCSLRANPTAQRWEIQAYSASASESWCFLSTTHNMMLGELDQEVVKWLSSSNLQLTSLW